MRLAIALLLVACAGPGVPEVRFANAPPVTVVDDRRDVPAPPEERHYYPMLHDYDALVHRPVVRALSLEPRRRALGVNAHDEVPDSTWFTNRIGVHELSPHDVQVGPATAGSPEAFKPWTIVRNKHSGDAPGLFVRDRRGIEFLVKFDRPGFAELESGAAAIASRLLWAAGYNVPEEHVIYVQPHELEVTPGSRFVGPLGEERAMTRADVDELVASLGGGGGSLRGLASRIIEGTPLGGHPTSGVRPDDPNDRIPHERRRDLRGAYAIFAWLDHADAKDGNTLDMWVADPVLPSRHYVKHYFIDFGKTLGVLATMSPNKRVGHAYSVDPRDIARSLLTGGLVPRVWDAREASPIRGVGLFDAATFDPGSWKPFTPGYLPFLLADARDKFWGAKIVARFTRAQIRAAAETARFTDPRAADHVADVLVARQRATIRYWFARTSPLDRFAAEGDRLCFDDLSLRHGLVGAAVYRVTHFDRGARALGNQRTHAAHGTRSCVPLVLAPSGDGYTIVAIASGDHAIDVHVARSPVDTRPRVIGIWRR